MLTNSNELIGQVLGTCTLQRLLGRGGMGAVYLARQSRPRRTVAVKVLLPGLLEEKTREEFLVRFRREADAIAALDHIHIMPIYEYSEQGDTAYLVMPYVRGGTLRDLLDKRHVLPLEETIHIIEQAAAGLNCAHAQGIIHRDLKPGNILFHADGRLLLADFGLAKVLKDVENSGLPLLTSIGTIVGTPEYLSPEQGTGSPLDVRSDVYSLGIVLYHMLCGRVPFTGTSPVAIAIKHAMVEPPPLRQFNPDVKQSVEAVVMKAIAKAPEQRFSSAKELARALHLAASEEQATHLWSMPPNEQNNIGERLDNGAKHAKNINNIQKNANIIKQAGVYLEVETHPEQVEQTPNMSDIAGSHEHVTALPTLLMHTDGGNTYNVQTEENRSAPQEEDNSASHPPYASIPMDATVVDSLPAVQPDIAAISNPTPKFYTEQVEHEEQLPIRIQEQPAAHGRHVEQLQAHQFSQQATIQPRSRTLHPSLRTILMASFLILFIIGGSLATYQHLQPEPSGRRNTPTQPPHIQVVAKETSVSLSTQQPQPSQSVLPTPPLSVPVGSLIYGTAFPSSVCDKQGGKWSNTQDASITCTTNGAQMRNNGNLGSHLAGSFLEQLPGGVQMPNDFIIQAQVTVNPSSQGRFGIYFRSQSTPNHDQGFVFLIDPLTKWTIYDERAGVLSPLNPNPVTTELASLANTFTIDLRIQGSNYDVYINGANNLGGAASGGQNPSGTIGLAVDPNANVTFKNVAIYALP